MKEDRELAGVGADDCGAYSATIGFGDVSGANADERLFGIFAMIMGGGIFAYGITNVRCSAGTL